jgi:hypothetical protein
MDDRTQAAGIQQLTGRDRESLVTALLAAFPDHGSLVRLASFSLNISLAEVAPGTTLRDAAFGLVRWAETYGRLADLLTSARELNPGNPQLRAWHAKEVQAPIAAPPVDMGAAQPFAFAVSTPTAGGNATATVPATGIPPAQRQTQLAASWDSLGNLGNLAALGAAALYVAAIVTFLIEQWGLDRKTLPACIDTGKVCASWYGIEAGALTYATLLLPLVAIGSYRLLARRPIWLYLGCVALSFVGPILLVVERIIPFTAWRIQTPITPDRALFGVAAWLIASGLLIMRRTRHTGTGAAGILAGIACLAAVVAIADPFVYGVVYPVVASVYLLILSRLLGTRRHASSP